MSIKREYEVKTHTVTEKICVKETIHCDICKSIIDDNGAYWRLTTGHNDWGNDSVDSIEYFDICSEACLKKSLTNIQEKAEKTIGIQCILK